MLQRFFKRHTIKVEADRAVYRPVIRLNQPERPVNFIARSEPVFSFNRVKPS